jgi:hypothetical protein
MLSIGSDPSPQIAALAKQKDLSKPSYLIFEVDGFILI